MGPAQWCRVPDRVARPDCTALSAAHRSAYEEICAAVIEARGDSEARGRDDECCAHRGDTSAGYQRRAVARAESRPGRFAQQARTGSMGVLQKLFKDMAISMGRVGGAARRP